METNLGTLPCGTLTVYRTYRIPYRRKWNRRAFRALFQVLARHRVQTLIPFRRLEILSVYEMDLWGNFHGERT